MISTVSPFGQLVLDAFVDDRFQFTVILVDGREGECLEVTEIYAVGCDGSLERAYEFLLIGCLQAIHRIGGRQLVFRDGVTFLAVLLYQYLFRRRGKVADGQ